MLQCLSKLIFESSVMPTYFTESLVSTVFNAKTSAPRIPQPGGGAQKGGPVNSQYVVLFNQRMIKVP